MKMRLHFALEIAELGIKVFPCNQDKTPATRNGFRDATLDPDQIRRWFESGNHLIGVPTGTTNDLFVLDIDPNGFDWLEKHSDNLACERIHQTRRGKHFLYRSPDGFAGSMTTAGKLSPGVDTRGDGGYVIFWPAEALSFSGRLDDLSAPPGWLIDALKIDGRRDKSDHKAEGVVLAEGDRNSGLASIAGQLRRAGLSEYQLFDQLQVFNNESCNPPLPEKEVRAIAKSISRYEPAKPITPSALKEPSSSLSWLEEFEMTEEEVEQINDPSWVIPNLVPEGHVVVLAAPPGAGKTTITFHLCEEIAAEFDVVYVHGDTNPADAKEYFRRAKEKGFRYLTPDMKVGKSMTDVGERLEELAISDADLRGQLWIIDTLKKMTDMIQKANLKQWLQVMRKLSNRGMSIILLTHTNKHPGEDGKLIFEGTGDLRADVDELIYLEHIKNADGSLTVTTRPDKVRSAVQPRTFEIASDRAVSMSDSLIDVSARVLDTYRVGKDLELISLITEALSKGSSKQTDIIRYCNVASGVSEHRVRRVLRDYSIAGQNQKWTVIKVPGMNRLNYSLLPDGSANVPHSLPA